MKKVLFLIGFSVLLFSCSQENTQSNLEQTKFQAFISPEFQNLQTTYNEYVEIESSVTEVFEKNKTEKLSKTEFEDRKEQYVQKLSQKMFEVKRKRDAFIAKYPNIGKSMSTQELTTLLRNPKN